MAEETDLESVQCGFKSHGAYMTDDPWDGWPDTPWEIDGYKIDDAICDLFMEVRDGKAREQIRRVIDDIRERKYDKKAD